MPEMSFEKEVNNRNAKERRTGTQAVGAALAKARAEISFKCSFGSSEEMEKTK